MDMNGRINSWNSGARRLLGWSTEEAIGKHSEILFPDPGGEGSEKASREIRTAWETGSATNERWHIRKDGSYRSEEHTSELQSRGHLVCRLLLEKKKSYETKDDIAEHEGNASASG